MAQLTINLLSPYVIREIPARTISGSTIEIISVSDNYTEKKVTAVCKSPFGVVVLWEGSSYDTIGQWTDSDVITRIHEIFGN